jgi:hypothetical protein
LGGQLNHAGCCESVQRLAYGSTAHSVGFSQFGFD